MKVHAVVMGRSTPVSPEKRSSIMQVSNTTATTLPDVQQPSGAGQSILLGLTRLWRGVWRPAHARTDLVAAAHARRCTLDSLTPADVRDMGLAREDATCIQTMQSDLPFFMQSGFGRKED
jgi:hypothetical protein